MEIDRMHEENRQIYFPNSDLDIGYWRQVYQGPTELHSHAFTEIAIIEQGHGQCRFEDTILPVSTGEVFVINRSWRHAWVETHNMIVVNVMIGDLQSVPMLPELRRHPAFDALFVYEPRLCQYQKGKGRLQLNMIQLEPALQIAKRLSYALHGKGYESKTSAKIQLLALIDLLCNAYAEASKKHHKAVIRVGEVIRMLERNWQNPPDIKELAEMVHVSQATFYRLFREATHCRPVQYVNRLRIKHACRLLRNTDSAISEIAFETGFSDSNYFTHIFHRETGMSPRDFREKEESRDVTLKGQGRILCAVVEAPASGDVPPGLP